MDESILNSMKELIPGIIDPTDKAFDTDLIMHINTIFGILNQLGVGPREGFAIEDDSTCWSDYTQDNIKLNMVKTYMYLKTKLIFDPPTSSSLIDVMERQAKELEWRLNITVDPGE